MNDQLHNEKGFLKEKLESYHVDPPESVWNTISARVGGRSRKGMVIIALAAAASLALAITLGINYFGPDISDIALQSSSDPAPQSIEKPDRVMDETTGPVPEEVTVREESRIASEEAHKQVMEKPETGETEKARASGERSLEERVARTMEAMAEESRDTHARVSEGLAQEESQVTIPDTRISEVIRSNQPDAEVAAGRTGAPEQVEVMFSPGEEPEKVAADTGDNPVDAVDKPVDAVDVPVDDQWMEFEEEVQRGPRWAVGAAFSPLYSFRDAETAALAGTTGHESGVVAYSAGMQVGYRTTRRLAVETGVFFNKTGIAIGAPGIQLTRNEFDFVPMGAEAGNAEILAVSNSVGNIVSSSGDIFVNNYKLNATYDANSVNMNFDSEVYADQGIRQHLDYLEVPLNLRYTLVDRSIKLQLVGGLSTNVLVNNYVTMDTPDGPTEIGYLTNIRTVNYSGNAGIGLAYYFLDKFSLSLEPRFRYFLNSVNDDTLPSTRPYTIGLYTGLSYFF